MKKRQANDAKRIGIFGASGSGKTTKAMEIVKNVKRVVFYDVLDDLKFKKFETLPELKRYIMANYARGFKIRFVPSLVKACQDLSELCEFLQVLQEPYKQGTLQTQITLFVDELDHSFPLNTGKRLNPGFYNLCLRGRHYGINLVGVSQRMSFVDLPFRANLSDLFIFRLADYNDLSTATAILGKPYKSTLQALPNYKYIYKNSQGKIFT